MDFSEHIKTRIISTADGSDSVYSERFGEQYHSLNGAFTESDHIFIKNGYDLISKTPLSIFEMGFGTGLNAFLTAIKSLEQNRAVFYQGLELFPLPAEELKLLNYSSLFDANYAALYQKISEAPWDQRVEIHPGFILEKKKGNLLDFSFLSTFDLLYFDAFSPETQPELWTFDIFKKIFEALNPGGILSTYSSKGVVKKALRDAGFEVKRVAGPPGKRHILVCHKT